MVPGNREGPVMLARDDNLPLKRTPLHALHVSRGGKMVPFAGYEMPVQYASGVLREHLHTRSAAGLFDVSHMGQIALAAEIRQGRGRRAGAGAAGAAGHRGGCAGRQRYAQFTNADGGILDDLMVANFGSHLFLVVNAACKAEDEAHLRANLSDVCDDRIAGRSRADRAAGAESRIGAGETLCRRAGDAVHGCRPAPRPDGIDCFVSRSGYTGEDGFEISVPAEHAESAGARRCWKTATCCRSGLGARDSLRLEAGLCLYGHDIDTTTTPVEGALEWSVQKSRRNGGARAGGFPGADKILTQLENGAPRRRVGLKPEGRAPVREGASAVCGCRCDRADRQGHLGRFRPEPQCAGRDGLSADLARRHRHHCIRRSARPALAAAGRRHALRSQHLQTLNLQTPEEVS